VITVQNLHEINPNKNILYSIAYFPESIFELTRPHFSHFFIVDWHDEQFKKELCTCISPLKELKLINPPTGYFSVAVHVRKGTGYDIDTIKEFNKLCLG